MEMETERAVAGYEEHASALRKGEQERERERERQAVTAEMSTTEHKREIEVRS